MKLLLENWRQYLEETERPGPGRTPSRYEKTGEPIAFDGFAKAKDAGGYGNPGGFLEEEEQKTKVAKPKTPEVEPDEYESPYSQIPLTTREKYFGDNPDELQCVKKLRNPDSFGFTINESEFKDCMWENGYRKLGAGSFRSVFTIPDNPNLVLKIVGANYDAKNQTSRAMEMNRKEAHGSFQTTSELVPKVYDSAKDYFWIISEKVTPLEKWSEMLEFFPVWNKLVDEGLYKDWQPEPVLEFIALFGELIKEKLDHHAIKYMIFRALQKKYDSVGTAEPIVEREADLIVKNLINNSMFARIRDLLAQFDLPSWDIRPHNVGYATRNGKKQFVVLDPGFELTKDTKEEQPEDSKAFSDLFKDKYAVTAPQKPNIMENWRHLIKESRGPKDFHYKITQSTKKIVIEPLNFQNKESEPGKVKGNAQVVIEKRTDMPYWQLAWSNSPQGTEGVGTIMYLMALELAGNEGLSPDDYEQSDDALRVWAKFMPEKNRFGVSKQKKEEFAHDNDENPFFFVFFKPKDTMLGRFSGQITYETGQEEQKPEIEPEVEPFNVEDDWDMFYDDEILQEEEPYQKKVKRKHRRMKFRLIGKGKNKHNVGKKMKKPSYKRSKSAPPGAGGT